MSLFHIKRYVCDDDDDLNEESREGSAQNILDKIKKDAESRKQQKLGLTPPSYLELGTEQNDFEDDKYTKNRKKSKKRKRSTNESLNTETLDNDGSENDCLQERLKGEKTELNETPVKRKKLRKKLSEDFSCFNDSIYSDGEHQQKGSVKKKQNKTREKSDKEKDYSINNDHLSDAQISHDDNKKNDADACTTELVDNIEVPTKDLASDEIEKNRKENVRDENYQNEIGGFTVLGEIKGKSNKQIKRVLPDWLAEPSVITADLKTKTIPISHIDDLDQNLKDLLLKNNITQFFPVQIQVIPMMLESLKMGFLMGKAGYRPSDICVSAPTGSGKTLAFVLPIVQALKARVVCKVRALVVLPVRDLATQVYKVFRTYCENTRLKVVLLVGQKQLYQEQQALVKKRSWGYESMADIIIATPGRLVDHISNTTGFCLNQLRFLIIDEADKMMDHVSQDWLTQVENAVYSDGRPVPGALTVQSTQQFQIPLQKLLFSATLSQNPDKLQQLNLFQPKLFTSVSKGGNILKPVDLVVSSGKLEIAETKEEGDHHYKSEEKRGEFVGKYTTPEGLTEFYVGCTGPQKPLIILHLLHNLRFRNILCFTNSVDATHRLYHLIKLVGGIEVTEFSSNLHIAKRDKILQKFSKGKIDIMICSDAMARGMDIENVKYVISYDPPAFIKTYIHRVGRTARAGKVGTAITLLERKQFYHFKKMTKEADKNLKELKVTKSDLQPIVPAFETALEELQRVLEVEKSRRKSNG